MRFKALEDQAEILSMAKSKDLEERKKAAKKLNDIFVDLPDKKQAWDDLIHLMHNSEPIYQEYRDERIVKVPESLQGEIGDRLGAAYLHMSDKKQAWADLICLVGDLSEGVQFGAHHALRIAISYVPDKKQAWSDLIHIAFVREWTNKWILIDILNRGFSLVSDIHDEVSANYALGRLCIHKATEAENEEEFKKELENAIKFFKNVKEEDSYTRYSADFCLPFYRSFYTLTFKKEEAEAEVQKYLSEAKSAIKGSESKEKLLEAVENLGIALKEVQKAQDFNDMKSDLNAYRRYCDRACELLETTEEKAPGASRLIRKGLPIIDERIKGILEEIQDKTNALCKEVKGTEFESLGKDINNAGQNLSNVRDPIGLEKQVQNMLIVLNSICTSMPEEERGDACEFLKKANDEHYIEDKLSSINMVLSKIPTLKRKAIVMTKIEIKNSSNTQVAVGNGNIQKIGTSTKPEYGLDEPEKPRKITKPAISIDEKIQQNNASIEQILDKWGFRPGHGKRDEKKADIEKWLHRFLLSEFEDAFQILERIQYHDNHTVEGYMEGLSGELKKIFDNDLSDVLFYPLGESPASSGGNLLYSYRKDLGLSESSFPYVPFNDIDLSGKKAIVFFDDIIGSGNQAVKFAKNHLKDIKIDKYYVALMAFEKGLENVRNNGCFKKVIVHEIISEELRAFFPGSQVFPDADTRERIKRLCEKYGKLLYPKNPLGYDDSQALIVFPHNTPNNTLPIIWASDKNEKEPGYVWYPVWERQKRTEKKIK